MPEPSSRSSVHIDIAPAEQRSRGPARPDDPFRILILGDFSGRANRGLHSKLAGRRPVSVDRDNLDEVLAGMGVEIRLPGVTLQFSEMDDFHPDAIYRRAGIFRGLPEAQAPAPPQSQPPGLSGSSLLDQMIEEAGAEPTAPAEALGDLADFLKRAVAPYLLPREDPQQQEQAARLLSAAGAVMRTILHNPDFQALEAAWRALFMLVRRLDTDGALKLYLLDATRRELADDSAGIAKWLTEQHEPWAVVAGNYAFEQTEEDAELLGRLGKIAREAGAPFLAEAVPPSGEAPPHWQLLRHSSEARWIGLALPRFLLRLPYGEKTSPVETFEFEEMPKSIHQDYLWGNPAFCCAYLLGQAFETHGWNLRPGAHRQIDGLPLHAYQEEGGPVTKPCAEVLLSETDAEFLMEQGIMPLASLKDQDAVLLVRFQSIAQPLAPLSGRWSG